MGWQDRPYYRDSGSSFSGNPLMWLFTGSVPLFTAFGIRVRMHASMLLMIALMLLFSPASGGMGVRHTFTLVGVLFGIVLLHEFGHCFAARSVGGDAKDILLGPLGGLAFADAPNRPWPQFVTVAGGPAVNVVLCLIAAGGLAAFNWHQPGIPLNPFKPQFSPPDAHWFAYSLWFVFVVSWGLLIFNLLPIYPLDGGRLLQVMLWTKLGLYRANIIAATVGMVGSGLLVVVGLTQFASWAGKLLFLIGINSLINCYLMRAQTKAAGPWGLEEDTNEYAASLWKPDEVDQPVRKSRRLSKRAVKRLRKQAQAEEAEQANLDAILAKVSAHGMQSLTWRERRVLHKATERQRQREVELSQDRD